MPSPAFLVEGRMEQAIVRAICPGQPVRLIGCNGDDVAISRMCDFIETLIRSFGNRYFPIIIIFDRERRVQHADQIANEVKQTLAARGLEDHDIRVFVADREAEDWYLMDKKSICAHYGVPLNTNVLTGKGGLTKLLSPLIDYHETTVGVDIFSIVNKATIAQSCPTFGYLMDVAAEVNCPIGDVGQLL